MGQRESMRETWQTLFQCQNVLFKSPSDVGHYLDYEFPEIFRRLFLVCFSPAEQLRALLMFAIFTLLVEKFCVLQDTRLHNALTEKVSNQL